ncbi:hypothetical protein B484DRAFT_391978, partial [Ochromonadaceae sp. CCMP2298]
MFVPASRMGKDQPVFYRCGPPTAPEQPYIVRMGDTEVVLEWYNPSFDGVPASRYKVAMRNVTRNFSAWSDLHYPGDITHTRFRVRDLPMGVACQFRVAGGNSAGWGDYSEATTMVTPGEQCEVLPQALKWRRLRAGGVLAVLDRLERYGVYRDEHLVGLRMLLGWGRGGYKSLPTTLRVAGVALKSLGTFEMDPEIINLGLNLLGRCLKGDKFERRVRQLALAADIVGRVGRYLQSFRSNPRVMQAIQGLRVPLMKYLPRDTELDLSTL